MTTSENDGEGRTMPKGFLKPGSITKTANPERRREIEARLREREQREDDRGRNGD